MICFRLVPMVLLLILAGMAGGPARGAPPGGTLRVGERAPDFTLKTVDGIPVTLSALLRRGPVLVNFWTIDCKFCGDELPHLQRLFERHRKAGLSVLAVNVSFEDTPEALRRYWTGKGLTFPCLKDERKGDGSMRVFPSWGQGYPTTYLIGKDRKVRAVLTGFPAADGPRQLDTALAAAGFR